MAPGSNAPGSSVPRWQQHRDGQPRHHVHGERGRERDASGAVAEVEAHPVHDDDDERHPEQQTGHRAHDLQRGLDGERQPPGQAADRVQDLAERPPGGDHADQAEQGGEPPTLAVGGEGVADLRGEVAGHAGDVVHVRRGDEP